MNGGLSHRTVSHLAEARGIGRVPVAVNVTRERLVIVTRSLNLWSSQVSAAKLQPNSTRGVLRHARRLIGGVRDSPRDT